MIVKVKMLQKYMERKDLSKEKLAQLMGVSKSEVEKMLAGEAVGKGTASLFINYFTAEKAHEFIDWEALGKENPLADSSETIYVSDNEYDEEYDEDYDWDLFDEEFESEQDFYVDDYPDDDWDDFDLPDLDELINLQEDNG